MNQIIDMSIQNTLPPDFLTRHARLSRVSSGTLEKIQQVDAKLAQVVSSLEADQFQRQTQPEGPQSSVANPEQPGTSRPTEAEIPMLAHGPAHLVSKKADIETCLEKIREILPQAEHELLLSHGILFRPPGIEATSDNLLIHDTIKPIINRLNEHHQHGTVIQNPLEKAVQHFLVEQEIERHFFTQWLTTFKDHFIAQRSRYVPSNNGLYPLRNLQGQPIGIRGITRTSKDDHQYSFKDVIPFIQKSANSRQRAALYHQLTCRTFQESDMQSAQERDLIGQNMVVATRNIPKGACLGVYGGTMIPGANQDTLLLDDTYFISMNSPDKDLMDGDNIISRINTTFLTNQHHQPVLQAPDSYFNAEWAGFPITLEDNRKCVLVTCFARKNISQGEEVRVNYNYSPQIIREKFHPQP